MRTKTSAWLMSSAVAACLVAAASGSAHAQHITGLQGCANQHQGNAEQRIAACSSVISSGRLADKRLGIAYALRGLAYLDRSDIAHAIGDLDRAIELAPDFAPAYQNRGNAWYACGNFGQALADYDMAIKLDPSTPSPYINRATVRRDVGYLDGALEDYQKAIAMGAERPQLYRDRGELYLRRGDYMHALADFDRAIALGDGNARVAYQRGLAHERLGERDKAIQDYKLALARNKQLADARAALERLTAEDARKHAPEQREAAKPASIAVSAGTPLPPPRAPVTNVAVAEPVNIGLKEPAPASAPAARIKRGHERKPPAKREAALRKPARPLQAQRKPEPRRIAAAPAEPRYYRAGTVPPPGAGFRGLWR
jgi:tetratricopeptide (TPR) repeat protein